MRCPRCQAINDDGAAFCSSCGSPLGAGGPAGSSYPQGGSPIRNYLVWSILVTIFCCWPLGIPAIVYASKANNLAAAGDIAGAQKASKNAKTFILLAAISAVFYVFILAAIAIPNFLKFQEKSKQSEARTILTGIYEAEMGYYSTEGRFSTDPDEIGFEPASPPRYYQWEITYADDMHFEARAWGNIDRDDTIDTWVETDQAREPENVIDDVSQ
jgi:Tfp pilus assembly protein PilE